MEFIIYLSLVGLLGSASGLSIPEEFEQLLTEFKTGEGNELSVTLDGGHCQCSHWGCWCHGKDGDLSVHAFFMVDETVHRRCSHTVIDALVVIGNKHFYKEFEADRFEDFCETVAKKRFCFRIDVEDTKNKYLLEGCLRVSRPHKVNMGCFRLPLLASKNLQIAEPYDDKDSETESMRDDEPSFEMESSLQINDVDGKHHCMCCEHGCICRAVEDGYNVVVILSVDEVNHSGEHTVIDGIFSVNKDTFTMQFHADELKSFCHKENGKQFCFNIQVRNKCRCGIRTCIRLTEPRMVHLGCFHIPLLSDDCESSLE